MKPSPHFEHSAVFASISHMAALLAISEILNQFQNITACPFRCRDSQISKDFFKKKKCVAEKMN